MQTWRDGMPSGMFLKSEGFASSLSDPGGAFTLGATARERGIPYADVGWPVPVEVFAAYGDAFARRFVPGRDGRRVVRVARAGRGFRVELEDGDAVAVGRVVLATGIGAFARVPEELQGLPGSVLTHSSRHADYSAFAGRSVAVIGAGASALDAAAALRRAGASATLVTRRPEVRFYEAGRPRRAVDALLSPLTPLGPGWKKWLCCEAPLLFHALPERLRLRIVQRYLGPSPARFVRDTIEGHVPYWLNSRVAGAAVAPDGRVALAIDRDGAAADTLDGRPRGGGDGLQGRRGAARLPRPRAAAGHRHGRPVAGPVARLRVERAGPVFRRHALGLQLRPDVPLRLRGGLRGAAADAPRAGRASERAGPRARRRRLAALHPRPSRG